MMSRWTLVPIVLMVACAASEPSAPPTGTTMTQPSAPRALDSRESGFALHLVRGFGDQPTFEDPDRGWARFLASAPLDDVVLTDAEVETVATEPLTLVLTPAGGRAFVADVGMMGEHRFVTTIDGERLTAGRIMFVGTARALRHPLIHVRDTGFAIEVTILSTQNARADTAVNAPPALLEHFRAAGKLLPAGAPPSPRFVRRAWTAEATSTKPGDPTSRVSATCDDAGCSLELTFRRPGSAANRWDSRETVPLPRDDFDAVWSIIERQTLARFDPKPSKDADRVIHPPRYRVAFSGDRGDGAPIAFDRAWQAPSTSDRQVHAFLVAAGALGRRLARDVPVNYFPETN
jgi:hypothetical protein